MDANRDIHIDQNKESSSFKDCTGQMVNPICVKQWSGKFKRWCCRYQQCDRKESCTASAG